jgi:hypothetical protein
MRTRQANTHLMVMEELVAFAGGNRSAVAAVPVAEGRRSDGKTWCEHVELALAHAQTQLAAALAAQDVRISASFVLAGLGAASHARELAQTELPADASLMTSLVLFETNTRKLLRAVEAVLR